MTALFDRPDGEAIPVDLLTPSRRGVSLLEFFTEGEGRGNAAAERQNAASSAEVATLSLAQARTLIDAAREEARTEGRVEFEHALERGLAAERARVEQVRLEFARDRERYFAAAEGQVVRLALAIARRVLCREVSADAMHLTGTVRAALSRVHDHAESKLKVPVAEVESWRAMFKDDLRDDIAVVGEPALRTGECVLETSVGRVELGMESQMAEIERGFLELMQRGAAG